jgi:hypothetical protein
MSYEVGDLLLHKQDDNSYRVESFSCRDGTIRITRTGMRFAEDDGVYVLDPKKVADIFDKPKDVIGVAVERGDLLIHTASGYGPFEVLSLISMQYGGTVVRMKHHNYSGMQFDLSLRNVRQFYHKVQEQENHLT